MKTIVTTTLAVMSLIPVGAQAKSLRENLEQQVQRATKVELTAKQIKDIRDGTFFETSLNDKNLLEDTDKLRSHKIGKGVEAEQMLAAIETGVMYDYAMALQNKNWKGVEKIVSPTGLTATLNKDLSGKVQDIDGIKWSKVTPPQKTQKISKKAYIKELKEYLSDFENISYSEILVTTIVNNEVKWTRDIDGGDALMLDIEINLDLRGENDKKLPLQKRSTQKINLVRVNPQSDWMISGVQVKEHTLLVQTRKPAFERMAANAGFDSGKVYPRLEALRRGGYAFAVEDFNNDGHLDAFVGNYGASTLWHGQKDGTFKEVKSEVNKVTLAKAAAFVDVNNDGLKDLLVTRFASDTFTGDVLLFKNNGGSFSIVENAFPSSILREYAMPMAVADYNGDGLLDVYIGFPGEKDFSMGTYDVEGNEKRKDVNGLFINKGNFSFTDETRKGIPASLITDIYPHGAVASDFNGDQKMDIVIMDDQMNLSPILKNVDNNGFALVNQDLKITNKGYGMGVATGDIDNDGKLDILMSNATFNSQRRLNLVSGSKDRNTEVNGANNGIRLFKNTGRSLFQDQTMVSGLMNAGEGAGGVTLVDYDNDGLLDIYLVNGLWSGSSKRHKIDSLFALTQDLGITRVDHMMDGMGERKRGETQSVYMRILMDEKIKEGGKQASLSFGGHQANRLFKNLGNGEFLEVGHLEGVGSMSDGYMSLIADVNKDGRPDLLLRNCDPGSELAPFPVIETFQNNHPNKNSLWLTFKGYKSNKMGVGVKVHAEVNGKKILREVQANNSAVQGEVMAHIGLGNATQADKVVITWPSGLTDTLTNLKAGRHVMSEGAESVAAR